MMISFIGAPCSGKTTTAAKVFATLKESGIAAEFVPEYARVHIAELRVKGKLKDRLSDQDVMVIGMRQRILQEIVKHGSPSSVVIADSSPILSLLYLEQPNDAFKEQVRNAMKETDLVLLCEPVPPPVMKDPNRLHTFEESLEYHERLKKILADDFPELDPVLLVGDIDYRVSTAFAAIMERMNG